MKLPRDVKQECLWIVRGYDRRRHEYIQARRNIMEAGGENYVTYKVDGEERRAYMPSSIGDGRGVENRQMQLEAIENAPETKRMHAVDYALERVGTDLPEDMRKRLRRAIMINCKDRHAYPFERLDLSGMSRMDFYRRRDRFLADIAKKLEIF